MHDKYIGAYTEVDEENRSNLALSLKKRMKSELYNATGTKQYEVHGDGSTGGVAIVKVTSMDVPDDMDEFKEKIDADYVTVSSNENTANTTLNNKRKD